MLAYDEETGEVGYYTVLAAWEHLDPEIVYLTVDDETIETTPKHIIFTLEYGWTYAENIPAGHHLRRADGTYGVVTGVFVVEQTQPMFDLTVDEAHTFFVGDDQWLVHNCAQPSQLNAGNIAHTQLELDYINSQPVEIRPYVAREKSFVDPRTGKLLRPDIVNHWTGEIIDFKTTAYKEGALLKEANAQVNGYADALNFLFGDSRAIEGATKYYGIVRFYDIAQYSP